MISLGGIRSLEEKTVMENSKDWKDKKSGYWLRPGDEGRVTPAAGDELLDSVLCGSTTGSLVYTTVTALHTEKLRQLPTTDFV
ncbi:unnamed protein product [Toxocara canis]|uniref:Uncharacterized protein n=1 Tax=Toxocara canis TaxID=6265 RepID=A0A183UAI0_TOXCA|nr:unnamed protein product [Toxocara canis]